MHRDFHLARAWAIDRHGRALASGRIPQFGNTSSGRAEGASEKHRLFHLVGKEEYFGIIRVALGKQDGSAIGCKCRRA